MADGGITKLSDLGDRSYEQDAVKTHSAELTTRSGIDPASVIGGAFTNQLPVTLRSDNDRAGGRMPSFFDDYYNRVIFIPPSLDLGPISGVVSQDLIVWNAHLNSTTIESIGLTNADGVTLDGEALPYVMLPLGLTTYTITVDIEGPPTVDAGIGFGFSGDENFSVGVLGARAKVSPVNPNWRQPYTIDYQFKTDIVTSRSGREQRRALRQTPRKMVEFEATPWGDAHRSFNAFMTGWHNYTVILPEVPRQAVLAAEHAPGELSITLADAAPDWVVTERSVVMSFKGAYETRRVTAVDGTTVTFAAPSAFVWPVGSKIHPALSGRLGPSIRARRESHHVTVAQITMDVTPASEPVLTIPDPEIVFNDREVLMVKPNWMERPSITYESEREVIDYGRGRISVFLPYDFTTRVYRATYTGRSFADMETLRHHFERMKGQRGEFYMPTWEPDIIPKVVEAAGTNTLRVHGREFVGYYRDTTVYRALAVFFRDGSYQLNFVESIDPVEDDIGTDSSVQVLDPWTQEVSTDNVQMICWMPVWRHATDTLTIEWLTNTVGQCQMTMKTLEYIEEEV